VLGCSHACAYCIIPSRRGGERSRALPEIASEVEALARQGVREVTLLGQIVDRYGGDLPQRTTLSSLLRHISAVEGIQRIRFLTSHPNWMNDELLETVASLPKVCEHVEVPVQSGDDEVLRRMRRGYTVAQYRGLVEKIRAALPGASIATDVIVGFPAESEAQFQHTRQLLADLRMDVVHLARYSSRPGTLAARKMNDDAPGEEKERRFRILERLQEQIASEINATYLGKSVEVLVTAKQGARWKGRTRTNKLVFVEAGADLLGQLVMVHITWTGAWSMIGRLAEANPKRTSGGTPHNAP
jgi:tRNA-2-methylthio-N6-dimethylallyladenosine synthase